jgi:hypothetical protein
MYAGAILDYWMVWSGCWQERRTIPKHGIIPGRKLQHQQESDSFVFDVFDRLQLEYLLCIRRGGCLNESCSAGMLMRAYRTGRYRHHQWPSPLDKVPSVKKGCRGIVAFNSMKCNKALYGEEKINLVQLDGVWSKTWYARSVWHATMLPGTEVKRHHSRNMPRTTTPQKKLGGSPIQQQI